MRTVLQSTVHGAVLYSAEMLARCVHTLLSVGHLSCLCQGHRITMALLSRSELLLMQLSLIVRGLLLLLAAIVQLTPLPWIGQPTGADDTSTPPPSSFHSHYDSSAQLLLRQACPSTDSHGAEGLLLRALNFQAHWDGPCLKRQLAGEDYSDP